jgi:hypothetical protein
MHGEENRESRLPHTRRRPAQSRHNAYRRHKKTPALVSEAQLIRLDVLRVSYARSLSWQRQLEGSGRLDRGQSWRHAGGVRNCVSGINASGADGASLRLYGRVSVAVMASSRAGSLPQSSVSGQKVGVQKQQSPRISARASFCMVRHQTNGSFRQG